MENAEANANVVAERLRGWNPRAVESAGEAHGETTIVVPRELLRGAAERLREDSELQFNLLSDITCVDRFPVEPRFELNYHLTSIPRGAKIRLRVRVPGDNPAADSVTGVWPGANWMEREIFDLFGVRFNGHPDLRRILLPDDWEGHPLRKDFPVEGFR
ncbi:MAG: NADH-quinone oxidoreductase subunit C [Acidobacteriia bacterium]|nr:NADH-quinone oxidoreductase subunit C [Terriglobia bacterium]